MRRDAHTPEFDAKLTKLWFQDNPRLSTEQIGRILGTTKNAIVGRAHRLGLSRESPLKPLPPGQKPRRYVPRHREIPALPQLGAIIVAEMIEVAQETPPPPPPEPARRDRPRIPCCWPTQEKNGRVVAFCEAIGEPGIPYCLEHAMKAYPRWQRRHGMSVPLAAQ